MPDKRGPSREHERFQTQPEQLKPRDLEKEKKALIESIKPKEQIPEDSQEKINKLLEKCKEGKCRKQEALERDGYKAFTAGKFTDPDEVNPGHIGYLFANNVLTEGRPLDVGEYKIGENEESGYAFYHKA